MSKINNEVRYNSTDKKNIQNNNKLFVSISNKSYECDNLSEISYNDETPRILFIDKDNSIKINCLTSQNFNTKKIYRINIIIFLLIKK